MPSNFDFLQREPNFRIFSEVAINAEAIYAIDARQSAIASRTALELSVKWLYSADAELWQTRPLAETGKYDDKLDSLLKGSGFRNLVGNLFEELRRIQRNGNKAAHDPGAFEERYAKISLRYLFDFLDFVADKYSPLLRDTERSYDVSLLRRPGDLSSVRAASAAIDQQTAELDALRKENASLQEKLTSYRQERQRYSRPRKLDMTEKETRETYIDPALENCGWKRGANWKDEVEVELQVPGKSGKRSKGYVDYVLYGKTGKALALIEAKRTSENVETGRYQAKLYADALEKKHGIRPAIFLSNGYDIYLNDGVSPERRVASYYSPRDLERIFNLRDIRAAYDKLDWEQKIADRDYQRLAVRSVCEAFCKANRRRALVVMATGSGKTRTVAAICDVLMKNYWVKNVLFLADRTALVTQAHLAFNKSLSAYSTVNLCEEKKDYSARIVFSTYQTLYKHIDEASDEEGRVLTPGHFDLVICDEAHRSIYNRYKAIFEYFDAPLIGLTATPKDEVDKNTYELFGLADKAPTFNYDLAKAVKDGWLVDYMTLETKLKFLERGIAYDELSSEEREEYEEQFADEKGKVPERIDPNAINSWLFNKDTIVQVLDILTREGIRVDYGTKLGKTIVFAKNHKHAEEIRKIFYEQYPRLGDGYAEVIDNHIKFPQHLIDAFSRPEENPQIAISVDMLDTGIDVPEVVNLVFFKPVFSKSKFWQMIGRGTRKRKGLIDGQDKSYFYIFDFCGNFEFFRVNPNGSKETGQTLSLQGSIFLLKAKLVMKLQAALYQDGKYQEYRERLKGELLDEVGALLERRNFAVEQRLKYVEHYAKSESYDCLDKDSLRTIAGEIAPLLEVAGEDPEALRFDSLMYGVELGVLGEGNNKGGLRDLRKKARVLTKATAIKEVAEKLDWLNPVAGGKLPDGRKLEDGSVDDFETVREELRDLMKYLDKESKTYETNYVDTVLESEWHESELTSDDVASEYERDVERYLKEHLDNPVVAKIHNNIPLSKADLPELERILFCEVGTEEEFNALNKDNMPLGQFVRKIIGLDERAAKEAFAQYLDENRFNSRQTEFVRKIIAHIVQNGMMTDLHILMEAPFNEFGGPSQLFSDCKEAFSGIRSTIERINANASTLT